MKFKLAQAAYLDCETDGLGAALRDVGYIFDLKADTRQVPGPHWEPQDDEAKAHCAKHGVKFTGHVPDCMDKLTQLAADSMKRQDDAGDPAKIGAAVVGALVDAGVINGKPAGRRPATADI